MEKQFKHKDWEEKIYTLWEKSDAFKAKIDKNKKPFTILLPPPNASGKMHTGNVLMIAIEDLLIRWKRMQGYCALWVPGTDHAGFETQTTFEKKLKKEGKTRFDFDRNTLYKNIMDFVMENKGEIENQMRDMGASVDWDRYTFTLDKKALDIVTDTFQKMEKEGLVYRDNYLVNYSFRWGTTFSDAEVVYNKKRSPLVYVRFPISNNKKCKGKNYVVVATVRPETIYVDTHLAINPKDSQRAELLSFKFQNPLTGERMNIIKDSFVDMDFGTGIVKITPAHDKNDFIVSQKHDLPVVSLIDLDGTMNENAKELKGETILSARKRSIEILKEKGLIEKIDENYENLVPVDYRSGDYVENLVMPNWFINVEKLKIPAHDAVKNGKVKIYPKWRTKTYLKWMENMHDWAISRQIVWGIRIPAWYDVNKVPDLHVTFLNKKGKSINGKVSKLLEKHSFAEIERGLQSLIAPNKAPYEVGSEKPGKSYLQETDTFDTWFSSGQWPFTTLKYPDSKDFRYFYPTDVLETGWEIVTRWVSRMIMFGYYLTGQTPFKDVYLHGLVRAMDGRKMSKSLGNVINPDEYLGKYGADALRVGLISGTANGKDFNFPHDKVLAYRNFANKIWNMARFMLILLEQEGYKKYDDLPSFSKSLKLNTIDKKMIKKLNKTIKLVNSSLEKYRFSDASEIIYHFMWEDIASEYIEDVKNREDKLNGLVVLRYLMINSIKLLHPFMPFVTEAIWQQIPKKTDTPLISSKWPEAK